MTPTSRTLTELRKRGYIACVVEQWLTFPERKGGIPTGRMVRIRKDCFGFADILACHPDHTGALLIQACVTGDQAKRLAKIYEAPDAGPWLRAKNRIECWGWAQRGARGTRKMWQASITPVSLDDLQPVHEIAQADELFQEAF